MLIAWDECHLTLFLFSICILVSEKTSDYLVKGRKKQIRVRISYLGYICAFVACYCGVGALLIFLFLWNRPLEIIDLDPIWLSFFFSLTSSCPLKMFCSFSVWSTHSCHHSESMLSLLLSLISSVHHLKVAGKVSCFKTPFLFPFDLDWRSGLNCVLSI